MAAAAHASGETGTKADRLPANLVVPVALGTLLQALNSSMIAVALVSIQHDFRAGTEASWLISGLYLATAVGAPTMGRLADLIGPRKVFLAGLAVIAVTSAAAPFAPNIGVLIVLRVLLGIGTSAPYPAGLAMIRAEADRRGLPSASGGLGVLAVAGQVAVALGPPLGGALVQLFGWQAVWLVNLPFVAVAAIMALRHLPGGGHRPDRALARQLDGAGVLLFAATMTALMLLLLSATNRPLWALVPVVVVLGGLLVFRETRTRRPFLDVRLLASNRALTLTYVRTMVTYVAFYMIFYGLPEWLQRGRGLDSGQAGLVMLPMAAIGATTAIVAARWERRAGSRPLLVTGSVVFVLAGLALAFTGSNASVLTLIGLMALLGLPNGFNSLGNQTSVYRAAPANRMGAASGLYRTSQYVGANLAAVVLALVFTGSAAGSATDAGLHRMAFTVAAIGAVLAVAALSSRHLRK
ncbi:MAG TPA: MFS transporter [Pseudonocardiaceae bacterium]|nr:MFS transporter [Pseudonocardiaceae bacterium]